MSLFDILLAMLCSAVGFTLQGAVGFGMGMLASPILILIDTRLVPGPVLASTMVFTAALTVRERRAIDIGGLRWAVVGRAAGTIPAAALLAVLPAEQLSLLFGGVVLLGVALSVSGLHPKLRPVSLLAGGALSGIMGTIAAIGGPPMALLYQHAPGARVRGTLSSFFLIGTIFSGSSHKCVHDSAPAGRPRRGKRVRMRSCQLTSGAVVCRSVDGRLRGPRF